MGVYLIYLVFFMGLAMFAYYIYIIITGKSLARLVGSKDRYIWNGLKNISDPSMPFTRKRNTLFLDHDNLVVSNSHVTSILRELRRTDGLDEAVVIPFHRIVSFDYKRSVADWNAVVRFVLGLWNRLIKKNDYHLSVRYLDSDRSIRQFLFKANSMDVNDFEATFADFDNQIYSGKVRYEAEHGSLDELVARTPPEPSVYEDDSPTVAISSTELDEIIIPQKELSQTEELPVLIVDDEPGDQPVLEVESDELPLDPPPITAPEQPRIEELPVLAVEDDDQAEMIPPPPIEDEPDEIIEEVYEEDDYEHSQTIQPTRRQSRNWFEEEYLPRRQQPEPVIDEAEKTVMMSREELMKKDVVFERPQRNDSNVDE